MACMTVTQSSTAQETSTNLNSTEDKNTASAALALSALCAGGSPASPDKKSTVVLNSQNSDAESTPINCANGSVGDRSTERSRSPPFNPLTSSARKDLFEAKVKSKEDLKIDHQEKPSCLNTGSERKRCKDLISIDELDNATDNREAVKRKSENDGEIIDVKIDESTVIRKSFQKDVGKGIDTPIDASHQQPQASSQKSPQHDKYNNPDRASIDPKYSPSPAGPNHQYPLTYHTHPPPSHHYYPHLSVPVPPCGAHPYYPYQYHAAPHPSSAPYNHHTYPPPQPPPPPPPFNGFYPFYYSYPKIAPSRQDHTRTFSPNATTRSQLPTRKEMTIPAKGANSPLVSANNHSSMNDEGGKNTSNGSEVDHDMESQKQHNGSKSKNFMLNRKDDARQMHDENSRKEVPLSSFPPPYPSVGSPDNYYPQSSTSMNIHHPPYDSYYQHSHVHPSHPQTYHIPILPPSSMMITPQPQQYDNHRPSPCYHLPHHPGSPFPLPYTAATNGSIQSRPPNGMSSIEMNMGSPISSVMISPGSPQPNKKMKTYSRKDKSLGLLCSNFMGRYGKANGEHGVCSLPANSKYKCIVHGKKINGSTKLSGNKEVDSSVNSNGISIDEAATVLCVERRRIYDIINILESIQIVSRKCKNTYYWHGTCRLPLIFAKMQIQAAKMWPDDAKNHGILEGKFESLKVKEDVRNKNHSVTNNQKEKSLGKLSQEFLQLFLVGFKVISLADATEKILGEACKNENGPRTQEDAEKAASWIKTKGRRLYDIANVMASIGIIKICSNEAGAGNQKNKRSFEWQYEIKPQDFYKILLEDGVVELD